MATGSSRGTAKLALGNGTLRPIMACRLGAEARVTLEIRWTSKAFSTLGNGQGACWGKEAARRTTTRFIADLMSIYVSEPKHSKATSTHLRRLGTLRSIATCWLATKTRITFEVRWTFKAFSTVGNSQRACLGEEAAGKTTKRWRALLMSSC